MQQLVNIKYLYLLSFPSEVLSTEHRINHLAFLTQNHIAFYYQFAKKLRSALWPSSLAVRANYISSEKAQPAVLNPLQTNTHQINKLLLCFS